MEIRIKILEDAKPFGGIIDLVAEVYINETWVKEIGGGFKNEMELLKAVVENEDIAEIIKEYKQSG